MSTTFHIASLLILSLILVIAVDAYRLRDFDQSNEDDSEPLSQVIRNRKRRPLRPASELVRPLWMTAASRETWKALNRNTDSELKKAKEKKQRAQRRFQKRLNRLLKNVGGSKDVFTREELKQEIRMITHRLFSSMYSVVAPNFQSGQEGQDHRIVNPCRLTT